MPFRTLPIRVAEKNTVARDSNSWAMLTRKNLCIFYFYRLYLFFEDDIFLFRVCSKSQPIKPPSTPWKIFAGLDFAAALRIAAVQKNGPQGYPCPCVGCRRGRPKKGGQSGSRSRNYGKRLHLTNNQINHNQISLKKETRLMDLSKLPGLDCDKYSRCVANSASSGNIANSGIFCDTCKIRVQMEARADRHFQCSNIFC